MDRLFDSLLTAFFVGVDGSIHVLLIPNSRLSRKVAKNLPIHLLPIKKSTYQNGKYWDQPMIQKWRPWVDMQEKYFRNDWVKPILVTDWDDMRSPYLLDVMSSGILVDMVFDAVKGMPSQEAAVKAQRRVEDFLIQAGHLKK